jgi:endoglycosylceramidase
MNVRAKWLLTTTCIAILGLLSVQAQAGAPPAGTSGVSEGLGHAGRWITDADGKVVMIHGVNAPSKNLPATAQSLNFGDDDALLLNRLGFNAVRLTLERYVAEPKAGQIDHAYIAKFAETTRILAKHGIYTLIDFHQDDFGIAFLDNGFPDWMTVTDGLPNLFFSPYPTQQFDNPAMNKAFDHLWANDTGPSGRPLQTDDANLLAAVATQLRGEPGLLGYEIINEPWPGTIYPQCMNPQIGCADFDKGPFSAYNDRIAKAIHAADPNHFVWYEPIVLFNQGTQTHMIPPRIANRGFAFHDYNLCAGSDDLPVAPPDSAVDALCPSKRSTVLNNALDFSKSSGDPLLMTEYGATMTPKTITKAVDAYDQTMIPWMWWSYTRYVLKLDANNALLPATDANVNWPVADALMRPYPQLIAGTPQAWHWDAAAHVFTMSYSTARAGGKGSFTPGATTSISVPERIFPKGYGVTVEGGRVTSQPGSTVLTIAACPGAKVSVKVSSSPGRTNSCG